MRTTQVVSGLLIVSLVLGLTAVWALSGRSNETPKDQETLSALERSRSVLVTGFEYSQKVPLLSGDRFPILNYPVLRGNAPDWARASVITVGGTFSGSALDLHRELQGEAIQKIHLVSQHVYLKEQADQFPSEMILLDARENAAYQQGPYPAVSKSLNHALGISSAVSAYLIDSDRTILHAQVNRGNFAGVVAAAKTYFQQGVEAVEPSEQRAFPIGRHLPLDILPATFKAEIEDELSKPVALVFLSDKTWCDTCQDWLSPGESFIESWQERGYGLILVEGGGDGFALDKLSNGVLRLTDVRLDDTSMESALLSSWGVGTVPNTFIVRDGLLQGRVTWLELVIEGRAAYRDIHFEVVEEIARTMAD